MRGKILGFDAAAGNGAISGGDGKRYNFTAGEWRGDGAPAPGVYVDFDSADGTTATALFPEVKTVFQPGRAAEPAPPPPAPPSQPAPGASQGGHSQPRGYPPSGGNPAYPGQQPPAQAYPGQQRTPPPPFPGQGQPSGNYSGQGGYPGQQPYPGHYQKSKIAAGLLALFLGVWGVHKFYLGYTTEGAILLGGWLISFLLTFVLIGILPLMAIGIVCLVEAIIYLTKSDEEFDRTYVQNKKAWF